MQTVKMIEISGKFLPYTSADFTMMASFGVYDRYANDYRFSGAELRALGAELNLRFVKPI